MSHTNISGISRSLILLSLLVFAGGAFAQSSISDADTTAGATTNYTYNFTLIGTDTLFPTERITITFPSVFDISNVLIAGSNTIDGGFDIFNITSTDIVIDRDGTGDTLTVADPGFEITFGTVTNPTSTAGGPHSILLNAPGGASGSASVTIIASDLGSFTITGEPASVTAGVAFSSDITVTALDIHGNTKTNYTGTVSWSSSDASASLPVNFTFTGVDNGVHTFPGSQFTLETVGGQSITVTDASASVSESSGAITVNSASIASFTLSNPGTQTAETGFTLSVSNAQDSFGNPASGTVSVSFVSGSHNAPNGDPPSLSNITVDNNGNGSANQVLVLAESGVVLRGTGGSASDDTSPFNVNPGPLDHFTVSDPTPGTPNVDGTFSFVISAFDANDNPVTFNGTVNLNDNTGTLSPISTAMSSETATVNSARITRAQSDVVITASGGGALGQSNNFTVDPGALDHFTFDTISSPQTAGTQFNITLTAKDQFENTVTSFTSSVTLSDDTGTISPTSSGSFILGVRTDVGVTITQSASNVRITATSGAVSSQSNFFNVTSQSVQSFTISTISSPQEAGVPFLVTITAKDGPGGTGNIATDFTGTVDLSLNSGNLIPTVSGNFINGVLTGNITVQSLGGSSTKILTAANSANASHTGSSNSFTTNPGAPAGTVTLTATPNTLPADGSSTSQVTSGTIFDSFGNSVGANKSFTVALSDNNLGSAPSPVSTNSSSQLDFNFTAGTTGGTVNVSVSSNGGSATGNTNISIGSMNITSISTAAVFVSRGQGAINVQMAVQNLSTSAITQLDPNLTFTGPGGDRTSQYTANRTDGITSIPAQGQATFTWDVTVGLSASLELITIDGTITGDIGGTAVSAQGAATPDTWTVQLAAQISAVNVTSPLDTVVLGQQGNMVTVQISNPTTGGGASAVIDDIRLKFLKNGVEDKSSDFPFTPLGGNPTSVPAGGAPLNFDFTVNVGVSADTGNYVVDFEVDAHDTNSVGLTLQDLNATTTHAWTVKGAPTLQILSLIPKPVSTFRAGQIDNWTVRMAVRNNGPDPIDLDFSVANTFVRFIIGVDVTNQYAIIQPTQLAVAGTNRLNSSATDTLDFIIDVTGTTTGTATITGRVEGTDVTTSNTIFDDTQDGGTGVVIITSQSETVSIAATSANTPNVLQNIGIVNTSQPFQVSVDIDNDLDEPVENVLVRLTTNGPSQIAQNQLTIPLIAANNSEIINFSITADGTPNSNGETFTAQILSATGQQTQQPAPIGPSTNITAIFRIQTAADLQLQFTKIDTFPSTDEVFVIKATVSNSGESLVDNSGTVDLTIPTGYTLVSGNLNNVPFTVNLPVQWQVQAPDTATSPQTFTVAINQRPLEFNTDTFAAVSVPSDAQEVQTRETDLAILSFSVLSPFGATDNTLSTDQRFTLRATISVTENIESVQADLTLPQGYELAAGLLSQTLSPGQTQVDWQVDAPGQPHNPLPIQVQMQGFDSGSPIADTTAQFNLTAILKATIDFDHFENNTIQTVRLSVGQMSTLTALVKNIGLAGVINGTGILVLDLAGTGINALSPLSQTFNPDVPVVWNIQAPSVPTQPQSISVTMVLVPQDENTNDLAAFNQPTVRTIQIVTGDAGGLTIDNISVSAPQGAADGVISTEQQFTITVEYSWQNTENLSASIVLPAGSGYSATSLTQGLTSPSGDEILQWQITAPVNATPQEFIRFAASGSDISSGQQVNALPDSLPFTTIEKARLNFNAEITAPSSATDLIVTIGQLFTVTASLPNTGEAGLVGEDTVRITLPSGYTITEPFVKTLTPGAPATWQIKAPDDPTTILDILVEIIDRNARDENTNDFPPLTPSPARVTIPVQTEAIGLNLTILNQRKPTTIVRGGTNSVFGLRFKNNSDTDIDIQSIDLRVKDNQNNDIAPNSVLTNLSVVDYDNNSTSFASVSPPGANPLTVNFSPALRIPPSQVQSIEFLVTIAAQTETNHFLLSIDSPQDDIRAIDVGSGDQVDIRDDSLGFKITNALGAGVVALTDPELEASFFNYPNPFGQNGRPLTYFDYNLQQNSNITIRIYTLLGELVKTISFDNIDPRTNTGPHSGFNEQIQWNGKNEKGQDVRNGVYVAVLVTDSDKAMTKIAVAK